MTPNLAPGAPPGGPAGTRPGMPAGTRPDVRPGLRPERLAALSRAAVCRCRLDLTGRVVLTEAATGAYAVTPVLAALAGAEHVYAVARTSRHATAGSAAAVTGALAAVAGVTERIETVVVDGPGTTRVADLAARADVVTNSGHVRPIDATVVGRMRPGAAVPLMYESWELRPSDLDLAACRQRGVRVAGTNERHPDVDVFSYLGVMAVKLLLDAGVAVYRSRILLLCDNEFRHYLERGLTGVGALVDGWQDPAALLGRRPVGVGGENYDAVLVALHPGPDAVFGPAAVAAMAERMPGAVLAQFWGDVDRDAAARAGVPVWPADPPVTGHMGVLPADVGPEPVVRLQAGGLKVGELLIRDAPLNGADRDYLQPV